MFYKNSFKVGLLFGSLLASSLVCFAENNQKDKAEVNEKIKIPKGWALGSIEVIAVSEIAKGQYAYTLSYHIPETEKKGVKNAEGKPIKGPIQQAVLSSKKPVEKQKCRILYRIDEPILYKLIDEIVYVKP